MAKTPSEATQIRNLKRELKEAIELRDKWKGHVDIFRARATKAEQEVSEWKARFDALLQRTPTRAEGSPSAHSAGDACFGGE